MGLAGDGLVLRWLSQRKIGVQAVKDIQVSRVKGIGDQDRIVTIGVELIDDRLPCVVGRDPPCSRHVSRRIDKNHWATIVREKTWVIGVGIQHVFKLTDNLVSRSKVV